MSFSDKKKVYLVWAAELLAIIAVLPMFIFTVTWIAAEPAATVRRTWDGNEIPEHWEHVVIGHGKASEWRFGLMRDHPFWAALCFAVLLVQVCVVIVLHRYRWQLTKRAYGEEDICSSETED